MHIEVAGVETHLCVMANAVIIQNMFPDAALLLRRDLNRSGHPALEAKAFALMAGMNMEIRSPEPGREGSSVGKDR